MDKKPLPVVHSFFKAYYRDIVLCLAAIVFIGGFFLVGGNRSWFREKIIGYGNDFRLQVKNMDIEHRKADRYESAYTYSKYIADYFKSRHLNNVTVLIPTEDYFEEKGITYEVPEPAVFYYYTGLKTTWPRCTDAANVKWYVHAHNEKLLIDSVTNTQNFADTLAYFRQFKSPL